MRLEGSFFLLMQDNIIFFRKRFFLFYDYNIYFLIREDNYKIS